MSKNWYPVIDEKACTLCGLCIEKCKQGVYDATKKPRPLVAKPEGCVQGCHGCGNICPDGAITFHGENTDWVPPKGVKNADEPCCCGE